MSRLPAQCADKNNDDLEQPDGGRFIIEFSNPVDLGWFALIGRPLMWLLQKCTRPERALP